MTSSDIRQKYLNFFKAKEHAEIKPARIVLDNDQTTLFTSSGMQPLIPYLLGETHPSGVRLVNSQPCFRSADIEEIGDNRHTTFFEMLGNWSLGDYFKNEEIGWFFEFLTKELNLPLEKLHVTCFEGNNAVPKDTESAEIWKSLGIPEERIYYYDDKKNWWSKSGSPDQMPVGEIGGPDTEVFYEFTEIKHDSKFGEKCHPNCNCGRFMEIANSVFIEYKKVGDNDFEKLPQKNVDFGGGLERLLSAANNTPDIFESDLFDPISDVLQEFTGKKYSEDRECRPGMRVVMDHMKAAVFLILDGVIPSNKLQGYVLRRLLRRVAIKMRQLYGKFPEDVIFETISGCALGIYDGLFGVNYMEQKKLVSQVVDEEMGRFRKTLESGLKEIEKIENIDGKKAFDLYQTYGFPYEVTEELFLQKGQKIDREEFKKEFEKHQELSRTASAGMFKGGLAGHSEIETKYHTATHLLHQALRDILGPEVFQKGSNINTERLRFDFSYDRKMTDQEIKATEDLVNKLIKEDLKVDRRFMSVPEAKKLNAIGLFDEKYAKEVSIYLIGPDFKLDPRAKDQRDRGGYYSAEFCGGPHVEQTGIIGEIKITKEEAVSSGIRRIYAELANI